MFTTTNTKNIISATEYQQIYQDDNLPNTLVFKWLSSTANADTKTFLNEIVLAAKIIKQIKPQNILLLSNDLKFVITPSIQERINQILLPVYLQNNVKKLAVVLPQNMLLKIAVETTVDYQKPSHKFITKYFSSEKEAAMWLMY